MYGEGRLSMIMNFELPLKYWLDSKVLALAKSYMTFDVYNKHSEQNIQTFIFFREKVTSLPCYFTIGKSLSKIFLLIKFLFINRFSNFFAKILQHVLLQTYYLILARNILPPPNKTVNYPRKSIIKRQNKDIKYIYIKCILLHFQYLKIKQSVIIVLETKLPISLRIHAV